MDKREYTNIAKNERVHFYYVTIHDLVVRLISKYVGNRELKILDVGCGTGGLMKILSQKYDVQGIDASLEAVSFCRKQKLKVKMEDLNKISFKSDEFDLITCIDVIYHQWVKNDVTALREMRRVLKLGGILIVRVPANRWLYSAHDKLVMTRERYDKKELSEKLTLAGYEIKMVSYVQSLFVIPALIKAIRGLSTNVGVTNINPAPFVLNSILIGLGRMENWLVENGFYPPIGVGLVGVAIKK